jgi:hypothetical protein
VALFLGAAGLLGWVAIGARVGGRLLSALGAGEVAPLWVAGVGTLVITLITVGLTAGFCLAPLGWVLMFIIGCFGLGAVVLTRFGTAPYVPGQRPKADEPPLPPALPDESPKPVAGDENMESEEPRGEEPESEELQGEKAESA